MPKGDSRGFAQVIAGRVHLLITNAPTTLKPYENVITLTASSKAYTVTLPQPSEAEDRIFTFRMTALASSCGAVSYTHLRAHETVLDLVCRLLLEKKKQTN